MKLIKILLTLLLLSHAGLASAIEIENVKLAETIKNNATGEPLILNGAGIRTKFIFDIYVCGLYLEVKTKNPIEIIKSLREKRIVMHFLYDEVTKEKLTAGWTDGFEENHSDKQMTGLKDRLDKFNAMFITVKKGNTIQLDFHSDSSLVVFINGKERGKINGHDFQQALLRIWLGEEPVTNDLKSAMLGVSSE
jgi:hypothetical protein